MASVLWFTLGVLLAVAAVQCRVCIFRDLSPDEIKSIQRYLEDQTDLSILSYKNAKVKDGYVYLMEAYRPNKTEALAFLDYGGDAPVKAARVVIHRGGMDVPQVQEYKVWPVNKPTSHERIINPGWKDPIPFQARSPFTGPEEVILESMVYREFVHIADVIKRATGGYQFHPNCTGKCLRYFPAMPAQSTSGLHVLTGYFVRYFEGGYLYPIGLQFVLDINSLDESNWQIGTVWYQGTVYESFQDMGTKLKNGNVRVISDPDNVGKPSLPASMNFRGNPRPAELKRGPVTYMPDGPRFTVEDRHISWMGWEFDFAMLTSTGIQLFDIKFLGERIVYELALQELSVFYSGGSPIASHTNYYDSVLVFGLMTAKMFKGFDCPEDARFFNFVHYINGAPHVFDNGACVFEMNRGVPLRRHYETDFKAKGGYRWASGIPDNVLVFRHMLTVLNYDYMVDVMFHQGGQVEVKVSLTGYVLTTFYTGAEMDKYGYRINDENSIGNVHLHTANFKVDMDINGTQNRFETLDVKLEEVVDSLTPDMKLQNRYVERSLKNTERQAAYKFNFETPKYLVVYNEKEKNKLGVHRGYRILNDGMAKMLLPESYRGNRARAWTNYQVAVTRQKEHERASSSIYTATEPFDPVMSFEDYLADNENIVDKDLVFWLTMGAHHIPHSEDVPVVTSLGVQLTFYLLPYNYFDEDPSMASRDNIRVTPAEKDGGHDYHYSGVAAPPSGEKHEAKCSRVSAAIGATSPTLGPLTLLLAAAVLTRGL